jgi:hypothetical protein
MMFYLPWLPSIPNGQHQAATPGIFARSFPSLPRHPKQSRPKLRTSKFLSTAIRSYVQQVQSHDIQYSVSQASRRKKSYVIDRGANGGIAGIDTRVIERHPHRTVDIHGIDNQEITSIPIVTAGAVVRSQRGDIILIMHQYTYHPQQGRSINSSCQLESFANDVNDKSIHLPGGLQRIQTVDGYVFPLSGRDGLSYLGMRPYTDVEYELLPYVILTSGVDWDPRVLDFDIDDDDDWYDAISDNVNHSELFDAFGNYKGRTTELEVTSADTWFDAVTPDQYTRVQLEEATIVCSEHAYRVHHFDNEDFDAILFVNNTEPVTDDDDNAEAPAHNCKIQDPDMDGNDAHSDHDMSNTEPVTDDDDNADAPACILKVQDPDYDKLRPLLAGWMDTKTIKKAFERTTQYARMPNDTILKKHYKSPFPALNVKRRYSLNQHSCH